MSYSVEERLSSSSLNLLTSDNLIQASIIAILGIAIVFSNMIIIGALVTGSGKGDVINYYFISLAVADLLVGLLIAPISVYPSLTHSWIFGDSLCALFGYLEATLWAVSVYTFMWISVDRYVAIRKPLRYETVQTRTRCQCWVIFTWLTSMLACCPPMLGFAKPHFDEESFICHLDWTSMSAYSVTLVILVLGPTLATIVYTYVYMFSTLRKMRSSLIQQDKEYITALSENLSNPTHLMSFILVMTFWLSWLPFICLTIYEYLSRHRVDIPFLHFTVFWLGICNSFWKLLIYIVMSPIFRSRLKRLCTSLWCRSKHRRSQMFYD